MKKSFFGDEAKTGEVVDLLRKILKIFYVIMLAGIIYIAIRILKELSVFTFIIKLLALLSPLFIGFIIAWLFNPLVTKLKKKGIRRVLGSIIVYLLLFLFIFIFIRMLVPTVYDQVNDLIKSIPSIYSDVKVFITDLLAKFDKIEGFDVTALETSLLSSLEKLATSLTTNLPETVINVASALASGIGTFLISLIIGFYMLLNFDEINSHFISLIPKKHRYEISGLINEIGFQLRKYVNGTMLCAGIICALSSIGFAIAGLQAPLLFGIFCGITNIIPYIGPYLGGAPAVLVGFSQGGPIGIIILILLVVIQTIEGNLLNPLIMSKTMKLHPVTIVVGLIVFGSFFGMWGMILATPIIAFIKIIFNFLVAKYDLFDYDNEPTDIIDLEEVKKASKKKKVLVK